MQAVGEDSVSSVNGSIIMNYSKTKMAILALSASIALISCTTTQVDTSIGGAAGAGSGPCAACCPTQRQGALPPTCSNGWTWWHCRWMFQRHRWGRAGREG